jgi:hypothetical protein
MLKFGNSLNIEQCSFLMSSEENSIEEKVSPIEELQGPQDWNLVKAVKACHVTVSIRMLFQQF